jgi:hypothetical protein
MTAAGPEPVEDLDATLATTTITTVASARALHDALVRAASTSTEPPTASLQVAAGLLTDEVADKVSRTPPRERVALRLLANEMYGAAWQVLRDTAAAGAKKPPLVTVIESPRVFADLPGFRDPRVNAAEGCYDITDAVTLAVRLDEVWLDGDVIQLGGSATPNPLATDSTDQVRLVLTWESSRVVIDGHRRRRPDLVKGTGAALTRRAWAGWSAAIPLSDPGLRGAGWALSLEIEHRGIVREAPIGRDVSASAAVVAAGIFDTADTPWRLSTH